MWLICVGSRRPCIDLFDIASSALSVCVCSYFCAHDTKWACCLPPVRLCVVRGCSVLHLFCLHLWGLGSSLSLLCFCSSLPSPLLLSHLPFLSFGMFLLKSLLFFSLRLPSPLLLHILNVSAQFVFFGPGALLLIIFSSLKFCFVSCLSGGLHVCLSPRVGDDCCGDDNHCHHYVADAPNNDAPDWRRRRCRRWWQGRAAETQHGRPRDHPGLESRAGGNQRCTCVLFFLCYSFRKDSPAFNNAGRGSSTFTHG